MVDYAMSTLSYICHCGTWFLLSHLFQSQLFILLDCQSYKNDKTEKVETTERETQCTFVPT